MLKTGKCSVNTACSSRLTWSLVLGQAPLSFADDEALKNAAYDAIERGQSEQLGGGIGGQFKSSEL